ncbi:uncharacterized protein C8A04DRAFT_34677 [Dichotomopilus funicola]|uniref:HNH nuclease domain-containing protein n=1 Tax=Dichotomopilus funicola TaxID=1934379 RepID=A0AAN6V9B4_9PEZI|nr:hypothetical protein C8A04DRAFT_34677 [Dichotomopilus funicola]
MPFLWHDDPLAGLPEIAPHPGRSESSSSALSSPPTSPIVRQIDTDVDDILRNYRPIHSGDDTAKVLRAFVDNLSSQGLSTLQSEIHATNPHQLRQLLAAGGGKQPLVTPSPNESEFAMTQIEGSSQTAQKSLKEECLRRDGNRCVALGVIDSTAYTNMPPGERKGTKCANTQCSYILPFALSNIDKRNATQTKNHETTWWALYRYFPALKNKIGANTINQPSNAITLISELHREFGQFTFGFKAANEILDDPPYYTSQVPAFVIVPQEDAEVQRPDPDILDVHMRIGRILQLSGIGFAIRQSFARGGRPLK